MPTMSHVRRCHQTFNGTRRIRRMEIDIITSFASINRFFSQSKGILGLVWLKGKTNIEQLVEKFVKFPPSNWSDAQVRAWECIACNFRRWRHGKASICHAVPVESTIEYLLRNCRTRIVHNCLRCDGEFKPQLTLFSVCIASTSLVCKLDHCVCSFLIVRAKTCRRRENVVPTQYSLSVCPGRRWSAWIY